MKDRLWGRGHEHEYMGWRRQQRCEQFESPAAERGPATGGHCYIAGSLNAVPPDGATNVAGNKSSLRAILCEIERGLFYITYPGDKPQSHILDLPTYSLGRSASEVKLVMEGNIRALGYETILWEDGIVVPPTQSYGPAKPLSATGLPSRTWRPV